MKASSSPTASSLGLKVVLPGLLLFRLALLATPLPRFFEHDHQLSSPLTSFFRLQEGIFLYKNGIDPYAGDVSRVSPLLLAIFSTVLQLPLPIISVLWTLSDVLGAWALVSIWRARSQTVGTKTEGLVAAAYLLNPYTLLPSLARSTSSLDNTQHILCLLFAALGKSSPALFTLAFLTHSSLTSVLLVPPVIMLLLSGPTSSLAAPRPAVISIKKALYLASEYFVYVALLAGISTFVAGSWGWVEKTWGAIFLLPDLTPNPGLWWYFFTEMFDHFRPFFLMAFSIHLLIYVAPICIKFQYAHDPLYAAFLLQGIIATCKSYPTLSDPGLFTSMLTIFPEIVPHLRHPLPTFMLHLHSALLLLLFHDLWLVQGTGNANFFYASTLVFGLANGAAVVDAIWAGLRISFGERGKGWAIAQL
ncbi:hypothetical protein BOTBODRAFT_116364 [Botryobasidium botryosum FD-172 SS1]|uniref:GPI transamidase component PIG-U n=1 Tax=Botryobasidium botryosum (strain FD-172 SS1) TaxID=930990 RepID=A0A067MDT0_BOTB1|nr:hypothetical protein BOTBODRAFT_116364 [Botryobasidium botryosum FD-172 SS1]